MFLSGDMSEARVAELLPYNFIPPETKVHAQWEKIKQPEPVNALQYLLERPYLHTDKSYYYPNETVWFRGYLNYGAKAYRDSLSQVLYVDMVDASQKIVLTKIFEVSNGMAIGNFVVPSFCHAVIIRCGLHAMDAEFESRWYLQADKGWNTVK